MFGIYFYAKICSLSVVCLVMITLSDEFINKEYEKHVKPLSYDLSVFANLVNKYCEIF